MTGSSPIIPSLDELRAVETDARELGGAVGATVLICTRSLCLPTDALAIDLERLDLRNGRVDVPARGGRTRILSLPNDAMKTILAVAGSAGGTGQAVTAGRGPRLNAGSLRLDRLQDALAEVGGDHRSSTGAWNFHGIRAAGAAELTRAGVPRPHVEAALGIWDRGRVDPDVRAEWALAALERWCELLDRPTGGTARTKSRN